MPRHAAEIPSCWTPSRVHGRVQICGVVGAVRVGFDALLTVGFRGAAVVSAAGAMWTASSPDAPGLAAVLFGAETGAAVAAEGVAIRAVEIGCHDCLVMLDAGGYVLCIEVNLPKRLSQ